MFGVVPEIVFGFLDPVVTQRQDGKTSVPVMLREVLGAHIRKALARFDPGRAHRF